MTEGRSASLRIAWPDFARGLCIILVVSGHITSQFFVHLDVSYQAKDVWTWLNKGFAPMRLPMFFLVSGFLSASAIHKPWRSIAKARIVTPYYLYLLWAIPLPLIYAALNSNVLYGRIGSGRDALTVFLIPNSNVWYLYALLAYFLTARSLRRVPKLVVLVVVLIFSMTVATWGGDSVIASVGHYPVFYIAGAYFPTVIRAIADDRGSAAPIWACLAYACALATYVVGWQNYFGIRTLCGLIGAGVGLIIVSRMAGSLGWIGNRVEELGKATLPIFLLHYPLLALVAIPLTPLTPGLSETFVYLLPVTLLVFLIPASLLTHRLMIRMHLGFLFGLPPRLHFRKVAVNA